VGALVGWLMEICERQPATMGIAIETPHGDLVEARAAQINLAFR